MGGRIRTPPRTRSSTPSQGPSTYHRVLEESFGSWYEANRDSWSSEAAMRSAAQLLLEHLPAADEHHILDIGTGRGRDLEVFLAAGHRATGVDVVEVEDWARLRARWGERVRLVKAPFQRFETADRYTGVLDAGCLHHQQIGEYRAYVSKLHELLVPGGRCVISAFTPPDERPVGGALVLPDQRINRELSIYQLQQIMADAGFRWLEARRQLRDKLASYYLLVLVERP